MNVFLVGGASPFANALIDKLNKNNHSVYLLTGKTVKTGTYHRVFERYDFTYESDSIQEILTSVQPDVVLFMGAYDINFDWQDPRKESVRFTASLMNLLSAYSLQKKGRLVYLSSQEVFERGDLKDIAEDAPTSAQGFRALTLVQGEEICKNYQGHQGIQCIIARLDHLYGMPVPGQWFQDPCVEMGTALLRGETLGASSQYVISMLHQNDAVEFLYRLLEKKELEHTLYHISSGQPITLYEIAQYLTEKEEAVLHQDAGGQPYRLVLSSKRFQQEFQGKLFVDYPQGIQKEWHYLKQHRKAFLAGKAVKQGGWLQTLKETIRLLVPYLEALICIVPTYFLNRMAQGNTMLDGLDIYLLYELLIALVHGQQTAVFAAFLAAGGYLLQQGTSAGAALGGLPDSKILNEYAFRQLIAAFLHARDNQLTVCALLKLVYWREILKWDYFWRMIGVGILSIAIAVMPMAMGVMQGNKLQGSLYSLQGELVRCLSETI